jgi:hypothetical protein
MGTTPDGESAGLRSDRRDLSAIGLRSFVWGRGRGLPKRFGMQANWNEMAIWNREGASFMLIGEDFAFHIDLSSSHTCVQQP